MTLRSAYIAGRTPLAAGLARSARGESAVTERDVLAVVEAWNARIPRNKVRVVNQERYDQTRRVLATLGRETVEKALDHYARQSWQRVRGAWKRFDNWMTVEVVTQWYEQHEEARERAEAAQGPKDPRVRKLQQDLARQAAERDRQRAIRRAFGALPPTEQHRLLSLAQYEMYDQLGPKAPHGGPAVRAKAREIYQREQQEKADGENPPGRT